GGMDLQFPHHECEIAQSTAALGHPSVRYWMHNNMITINGQKMARSLGNFITLDELFCGKHPLLTGAYSPMTIRFFILQAHYRSTLDFSNEALLSAGKGLERLMKAASLLEKLPVSETTSIEIGTLEENCRNAMNDDLNSPILIAHLFEGVRLINLISDGKETITVSDLERLRLLFRVYLFDILGLKAEENSGAGSDTIRQLVELTLQVRSRAKTNKDWTTSDYIRDELAKIGIIVKDRKEGAEWEMKN
ncbi:MAG: cysteine--tRNA ligase, partial [Prolixibacteraceae bacterium]|nr:cysteine--tRNA ligase [Prolixibacteraceae bacterium]